MSVNINNLSYNDFPKICRTCLSKENLQSLYTNKNLVEIFVWLKCGTKFEFEIEGFLPNQICNSCIQELIHAYSFLKKCKSVYAALKQCLGLDNETTKNKNDTFVQIDYDTSSMQIDFIKKEPLDLLEEEPAIEVTLTPTTPSSDECLKHSIFDSCTTTSLPVSDENEKETEKETETQTYKPESDEEYQFDSNDDSSSSSDEEIITPKVSNNKPKVIPNLKVLKPEEIEEKNDILIEAVTSSSTKCPICGKKYVSTSGMKQHMERHGITKQFIDSIKPLIIKKAANAVECLICQKMIASPYYLKAHMRNHELQHPEIKKNEPPDVNVRKEHKCNVCKKRYETAQHLENHQKGHKYRLRSECFSCHMCFKNAARLSRHVRRSHVVVEGYACDVCKKTFMYQHALMKHKLQHQGGRQFKCIVCRKMFRDPMNWVRHLAVHDKKKIYPCNVCFKVFYKPANFLSHASMHPNNLQFMCDVCNKIFLKESNFDEHKKVCPSN